jgi:hypothetical protein
MDRACLVDFVFTVMNVGIPNIRFIDPMSNYQVVSRNVGHELSCVT